jgi:hypothetical protein
MKAEPQNPPSSLGIVVEGCVRVEPVVELHRMHRGDPDVNLHR